MAVHNFKTKEAFHMWERLITNPNHKKRRPREGDVALIEETNESLMYNSDIKKFEPMTIKSTGASNASMSMFEYNQQILAQLPELTDEGYEEAKNTINSFINDNNEYYMLLNNNQRYYTIFTTAPSDKLETQFSNLTDAIITVCKELGAVKAVDNNGEGALEIWITIGTDTDCYLLFPYDNGIIKVGK